MANLSLRRLSTWQRDILIEHIDCAVALNRRIQSNRSRTVDMLIRIGLLRNADHLNNRPQYTVLTEEGRAVVAKILAQYADALVRAGVSDLAGINDLPALVRRSLSKTLIGQPPLPRKDLSTQG